MSAQAHQAEPGTNSHPHYKVRQEPSPGSTNPSKFASATPEPTSSPATLPPQPTTVIPLTTTFTPPESCTESRLSMLPPPGYMIWENEPVPAENVTSSACFPSEFLKGYQSVSLGVAGSSIVPAMSPLICPANYCTMFTGKDNYVACCPSGYQFHPPDTTIDTKRPGYGGTCYSDFVLSSTYTVTQFNASGDTNLAPWVASVTGAQAYAHPIDGFAASGATPAVGCLTPSSLQSSQISSQSQSHSIPPAQTTTPSTLPTSQTKPPTSKATIAGASAGAVGLLVSLIFLTWFILRCIRKRKAASLPRPTIYHIDHDLARRPVQNDAPIARPKKETVYEKDGSVFIFEMATSEQYRRGDKTKSRLNDGLGAFEMPGDSVPELDGGGVYDKGKQSGTSS